LETRLTRQRFLMGETITEADVRLFPTLVRFDAAYHGHFKCNIRKLIEYPALWAYARDLFRTPGFGDTVDLDHIRRHYYHVHTALPRPHGHQPDPHRRRGSPARGMAHPPPP
jgi:putative glutathione S-transferase